MGVNIACQSMRERGDIAVAITKVNYNYKNIIKIAINHWDESESGVTIVACALYWSLKSLLHSVISKPINY